MHIDQPPDPLLPGSDITLKPPKPHLFVDLVLHLDFFEPFSSCTAIVLPHRCWSVYAVLYSAAGFG